jgi:transposase
MYLKVLTQKNKKDGHVRKYLQLVESKRTKGQPRQVVLASLGRFDTDQGEKRLEKLAKAFIDASQRLKLINLAEDLKALNCKEYGPLLVFKRIWQELALGKVLTGELNDIHAEFDVTEAIFNMVLNRLTAPSSKRQLNLWEQHVDGIESFELHQYYRALDYLIEHKDKIEQGIFCQMRDLFHAKVDVVLFDTTTVAYYGDSDQHEELLDYGFSKIRRSDLKQIVVGIIMSKEGIPLGHDVFEGNTNDVTCFKEIIGKISSKFSLGKVVLVGDRGMISKKNIEHLEEEGYQYILGYRMRTIPKEDRHRVFSSSPFDALKGSSLQYKEVTYDGQRLIVCFNPERAEKDREHRERILERLEKKISTGKLASVIDNTHYKRFLRIKGEKPTIDEEKVKRDAQYDGMFVLTTNTSMSGPEVVMGYKDLWQVELAFRQLKSEIEMGPIYHWKDRRIRAHIMICFLAFVLRTVLYKKLKAASEKKVSYSGVVTDLKALQTCELELGDRRAKVRTEMKPGAVLAMKATGMRPPNRILNLSGSPDVVVQT